MSAWSWLRRWPRWSGLLRTYTALSLACSGARAPAPTGAGQADGCEPARQLREHAAELYVAGKVDRAHRTIDAANVACATEASSSWGLELGTLIDLGLNAEATTLARTVSSSPEASPADVARAQAWLAAPGAPGSESGEQLLAAGLAKKAEGDVATAQRLFDRARVALQAKAGSTMVLEPKRGLWDVSAMGWAPDGSALVLGVGGVLHWLETNGYRETSRLSFDGGRIASVAFSPDGRRLAVAIGEGGALLWDVEAAQVLGKLESEVRGALRTLVFSPDGALLVGRSWEDSRAPAWRLPSRQPLPPFLPVHRSSTRCGARGGSEPGFWPAMLAFSPDGGRLLGTCGQDLGVWSPGAGREELVQVLPGGATDALYSVAWHPDGRHAVAGTEAGAVVTWDVGAGRRLGAVPAHAFNALAGFSRDGQRLVSAAVDGVVRSFTFASVSKPGALHSAPIPHVEALAIHPDATRVALAGGGAVVVQEAVTGEVTEAVRAPLALSALAVDARLAHLAFGTTAGAVGVLDVAVGAMRWSKGHTDAVSALAFSPDGASLASAGRDRAARLWDVKSGRTRVVLPHGSPLTSVAYRGDGQVLATAGDDGVLQVWDAATGKAVRALQGSSCSIAALGYGPDGSLLVASAADHALLRWDARTYVKAEPSSAPQPAYGCGGELRPFATSLAFSSDGAIVASAPAGNAVELWSARTGERQGSLGDREAGFYATAVALSPRDPLVVATGGPWARAWRLPEQTEVAFSLPPGGADSLVFSADGRFLLGATHRGTVAVWRVGSGGAQLTLVLTLEVADEQRALALSAEGLVQQLGPEASGACVLGSRVYPVELCEERFASPGLLPRVLSGK